ncbi:MAG: flagellar hook-basal body complex protein [Lachnospiraceae bacterium]|nr:flagellar hook-basal body complex protein [Lachnospiraceae bacterium]MDD6192533.1 flagellar hook-basal body complex protein [Lachnospiraceae bacterium]MDY4794288.1 flagellar hook-basal body complex protein [Pararoseburia sp.]
MMRALYSGVSGLKTHQTKMDVIGNNIANVNTVGFKASSVTFSDIMYQTTSGASGATATTGGKNAKQIGLGVSTAATKVSITSGGAAQSTGDAFDIKLTDSNSTNFFVVNNGTENLFTRAGSFYIDGAGNLAMTSTGYNVMGWQVDPATGAIRKDTVSALRVMQASNMTSAPEATTNASVSGIIDKNDKNVTSDDGYFRTLTFFDNLGYSYTAKFSFKVKDVDAGQYSVELVNLYDSNDKDILAEYLDANPGGLDNIFGNDTTAQKSFAPNTKAGYSIKNASIVTTIGGVEYSLASTNITKDASGNNVLTFTDGGTPANTREIPLTDVYANLDDATGNGDITKLQIDQGQLVYTYDTTNFGIEFYTNDGTFKSIDGNTDGKVTMNLKGILGDSFEDIEIDFSHILNQNNGGSSTAEIERGATDGITGMGKKLGTMTGVSIDGSGCIYGSYDNGNTVLLGQIAVAQFANASGLESLGNNCYGTTLNSGDFDGIGVEVTADGGSMTTGQLEMSNVDLSAQFTEMITTQRGFQANSRIITTSDTLLEELVNLKR